MAVPSSRIRLALLALVLLALVFRVVGTRDLLRRGFVGIATADGTVTRVTPGLPADRAGLRVGDLILEEAAGRAAVGDSRVYVVERDSERMRFEMQAVRMAQPMLGLTLATATMGVVFLLGGLLAFQRRRDLAGILWLLYGVGTLLHWGGWPHAASAAMRDAILSTVMLSTMLGGATMLHLTLVFPSALPTARRRGVLALVYGAMALGLVLAAVKAPLAGSPTGGTLTSVFFLLASVEGYLYTSLALVVLIARYVRSDRAAPGRGDVGLMIAGLLGGTLPYLAISIVEAIAPDAAFLGGVGAFPYTLGFTLIAVAFTRALLRDEAATSG